MEGGFLARVIDASALARPGRDHFNRPRTAQRLRARRSPVWKSDIPRRCWIATDLRAVSGSHGKTLRVLVDGRSGSVELSPSAARFGHTWAVYGAVKERAARREHPD